MTTTVRSSKLLRFTAAGAIVASIGLVAVPTAHADNNKGTIKISETGTDEIPDNNPKVCPTFYIRGYGISDKNATFAVNITDPNGMGTVYQTLSATTDSSGNFVVTVSSLSVALQAAGSGPFKVTLADTAKEKSKVFKIDCTSGAPGGAPGGGSTPPAATPELGSGELLATGLLPIGAILLYRRRRARHTPQA